MTLDDEMCDCEIGFPTIKEIDGRIDEILWQKVVKFMIAISLTY